MHRAYATTLRRYERRCCRHASEELALDAQFIPVQVAPLQAEQFSLPHYSLEREREERGLLSVSVRLYPRQELACFLWRPHVVVVVTRAIRDARLVLRITGSIVLDHALPLCGLERTG